MSDWKTITKEDLPRLEAELAAYKHVNSLFHTLDIDEIQESIFNKIYELNGIIDRLEDEEL